MTTPLEFTAAALAGARVGAPDRALRDEVLARSMEGQFKRMKESGIDRLLFSPQASAMGHHFGSPLVSRYWTEACNDLIGRVARLWPDFDEAAFKAAVAEFAARQRRFGGR